MKRTGRGQAMRLCALAFTLAIAVTVNAGAGKPAAPASQWEDDGEICVALTFDDGPRIDTTTALLDGLRARGIRATFFVIGSQIEGNEALLCRMKEEGHQIGQHTWSHVALESCGRWQLREELRKTELALIRVLGEGDYWLRPPYGLIREEQHALVQTPLITWSLDPKDWECLDTNKIVSSVLETVSDGDVILLHDIYPTSVEAALTLVDRLSERGVSFLTVEELLAREGIEAQNGVLYNGAK